MKLRQIIPLLGLMLGCANGTDNNYVVPVESNKVRDYFGENVSYDLRNHTLCFDLLPIEYDPLDPRDGPGIPFYRKKLNLEEGTACLGYLDCAKNCEAFTEAEGLFHTNNVVRKIREDAIYYNDINSGLIPGYLECNAYKEAEREFWKYDANPRINEVYITTNGNRACVEPFRLGYGNEEAVIRNFDPNPHRTTLLFESDEGKKVYIEEEAKPLEHILRENYQSADLNIYTDFDSFCLGRTNSEGVLTREGVNKVRNDIHEWYNRMFPPREYPVEWFNPLNNEALPNNDCDDCEEE